MAREWKKGIEVQFDPFGNAVGGLSEEAIQPWMQEKAFVLIDDLAVLTEVVDAAIASGAVVIDLETQGLDTRVYGGHPLEGGRPVHHIVGFALCYDGEVGFYAPVRHVSAHDSISNPDNGNLPWKPVAEQIQRLLDNCICIYHNATFDTEMMWGEGFNVPEQPDKFDDTQVMGWLVDSNRKRIGLKSQSKDILGWQMIEFKSLFPKGTKIPQFEELHPEEAYVYASGDGICTWHLWNLYKDNLNLKAQGTIYKIEKMLIGVLRRMSRNRFRIDVDYLQGLDDGLKLEAEQMETDIRKLVGDSELNIGSAKALGEALFDKLSVPNAGKTPSGAQWKTDAGTLEELDSKYKGKYPALTMVVKYRQLLKLRGTYLNNLINNVDQFNDGRFGIMACGAPTGRFAAPGGRSDQGYTGVNAQAVPKVKKGKPNIRKGFIARDGFVIAAIDFAGVELRIAGNQSGESKWVTEFNHNECKKKYGDDYEIIGNSPLWHHCPYCHEKVGDIHSQTSVAVFGTSEEPYRGKSKGVNFGILYGAGGKTLARNIGVPEDEGYRIQKSFLDNLPGIKRWIKKQHSQAAKTQMVKTSFGRIRLIPEMLEDDKRLRSFGERTSVNTVVQGTSADITKIAMVMCDKLIERNGWREDCRILLTVHDEIVFEVRDSMKFIIMPELGLVMSRCGPKGWKIPLTVDIEWGSNWGEANNAWKPPAPVLKCLREGVKPLHPGDLYFDGRTYNGPDQDPTPAGEAPPTPAAPEVSGSAPEASTPPPTPENVETSAPAPEASGSAPEAEPEPVQEVPTVASGDEVLEYVVCGPYTKNKLRKLEALFILTGSGTTKLVLKSETGAVLNATREIRVDSQYFQYKAVEWGL